MYKNKYTIEKIKAALEPWEKFKYVNIPVNSINSKLLYDGNSSQYVVTSNNIDPITDAPESSNRLGTNLLFLKHRSTISFSPLHHWFLDINNVQRWHPGNGKDENILMDFKTDDNKDNDNILVCIYEFCHKCTYWFLLSKFYKDESFHIAFHNCEIIFDYVHQTFFVEVCIISYAFFCFTGYILLVFISILAILLIYMSNKFKHNSVSLYKCPHVRDHVYNRGILKVI